MKTHKTDITVHWGDCDPAVIVYYPNYFHWFDASTVNLFAAVGLALKDLYIKENLAGIPILDAGAKFIRPSRFQDVITVESGVEYWRQSSFRIKHTIYNDSEVAVEGHEVRAWVRVDEGHPYGMRAFSVPNYVRERFDDS